MPAASRLGDLSTGHGCFPPTAITTDVCSKTTIEGPKAAHVGSKHATHACPPVVHPTSARPITSGAPKTTIEGSPAARIGDPIGCGDAVGQGASKTFIS
jgi:uncharacterized Zn-binding protein involved in type VI secretion